MHSHKAARPAPAFASSEPRKLIGCGGSISNTNNDKPQSLQDQRQVLARWARQLAREGARLQVLLELGLLTQEQQDAFFEIVGFGARPSSASAKLGITMTDKHVRNRELERRRSEAARTADKYIAKDGGPPPDLSRLDSIGSLSPADYGQRRVGLAEIWRPRLGRDLSREDARQIAENITGFFDVLAEWSRPERGPAKARGRQPTRSLLKSSSKQGRER
jgi:hypothetical protein